MNKINFFIVIETNEISKTIELKPNLPIFCVSRNLDGAYFNYLSNKENSLINNKVKLNLLEVSIHIDNAMKLFYDSIAGCGYLNVHLNVEKIFDIKEVNE